MVIVMVMVMVMVMVLVYCASCQQSVDSTEVYR